uniref:Uncharacterized protein n=1 Tax=Rhizophora mucronata TaxID=61149 RepID=A0A2P2NQ45_RHIMU
MELYARSRYIMLPLLTKV